MSTFSKMTAAIALAAVVAAPMNVEAKKSNTKKYVVGAIAGVVGVAAITGAAYYFRDDLTTFGESAKASLGENKDLACKKFNDYSSAVTKWVSSFFAKSEPTTTEVAVEAAKDAVEKAADVVKDAVEAVKTTAESTAK